MKPVFCGGHASSGCETVYETLRAMGLAAARPSSSGLLPWQLAEGMPSSQADNARVRALASEIVEANADSSQWGWYERGDLRLLDFWRTAHPDIRFVLCYAPADLALVRLVGSAPDAAAIAAEAAEWVRFHRDLMRFYLGHQDRCVLINTRSSDLVPARLQALLHERFALKLQPTASPSVLPGHDSALALLTARAIGAEFPEIAEAFASLESVADVMQAHGSDPSLIERAFAELRSLDAGAPKTARDAAGWNRDRKQAYRANAPEGDWQLEKAALEAQLRQSQEELDAYTARFEELLTSLPASGKSAAQPDDISAPADMAFDVRNGFAGDNWYYPEADGRWAGPNGVSTIRLPKLRAGRYGVELDIVDAIAPDVFEGMRCYVNGVEMPLEGAWAGYPAVLRGEFEASDNHAWLELQLQFPRTTSPAALGNDPEDRRELAIRLRAVRLQALDQPAQP